MSGERPVVRLSAEAMLKVARAALPIAFEAAGKRRDRNSPSAFIRWDALEELMSAFETAGVELGRKRRQA